jgi:hypothetical protein
VDSDSVVSRRRELDGDEAVTRADRCPISAPPTPMASAIDCVASAEGWPDGVSTGAASAGEGEVEGTAGAGAAVSVVPPAVEEAVGAGAGSTADATPAKPGPDMSEAAKSNIPKDCRVGRRD